MAVNVRNGANSAPGSSLVDNDPGASLFVAVDGFFTGTADPVVLTGDATGATSTTATVAGVIAGDMHSNGIAFKDGGLSGSLMVVSSGNISGSTAVQVAGQNTLVNHGKLFAIKGIVSTGFNLEIVNTGNLFAYSQAISATSTGGCDVSLYNSGQITGDIALANGSLILRNSGGIQGSITITGGDHDVSNSGTIDGDYSGGNGNDTFINSGKLIRNVDLGGGMNTFSNAGSLGGRVTGGSGLDQITNEGQIGGSVELHGGINMLQNSGSMGALSATTGAELQNSGLIRGNVTLGGSGSVVTNSGTINGDVKLGSADDYFQNSGSVSGMIRLAAGADTFNGGTTNEIVGGGAGNDTISGAGGNDRLLGDAGADKITGGSGRDVLTGGADADTFIYLSKNDSTASNTGRDYILDFIHASDKVNLAAIDANAKIAGDQAFTWKGFAAFSGVAGQLHATYVNGYTVVSGDTDGDKVADFSVGLLGNISTLSAADFIL